MKKMKELLVTALYIIMYISIVCVFGAILWGAITGNIAMFIKVTVISVVGIVVSVLALRLMDE
jgi:uncharacterized membrane protein